MENEPHREPETREESAYFAARRSFLNPPWNNKQLTFREVRRAGWALAGNPNDLRLFGLNPFVWYALGIRIRGRTAVEVTRDQHAQFLGQSVAHTLADIGVSVSDVIDPFVGSGNLLFHVVRATKAKRAVGLDNSADVMSLTQRNFARLRSIGWLKLDGLELHSENWKRSDFHLADRPTLVIVAPPWGDAFDAKGLDLRKTAPSMGEVLKALSSKARTAPLFAMLQTHPLIVAESVEELRKQYQAFPSAKPQDTDTASRVDYLLLRLH